MSTHPGYDPWVYVVAGPSTECWPWAGPRLKTSNYGYTGSRPRKYAHRWVYEQTHGPIPKGMTIDHVCHNEDRGCPGGPTCPHRLCVNPAHLEPATQSENVRRAHLSRTHCRPGGHEFTEANTYVAKDGRRQCRACHAARHRAYREEKVSV